MKPKLAPCWNCGSLQVRWHGTGRKAAMCANCGVRLLTIQQSEDSAAVNPDPIHLDTCDICGTVTDEIYVEHCKLVCKNCLPVVWRM